MSSYKRTVSNKKNSMANTGKGRPVNKVKKGNTVRNRSYSKKNSAISKRSNNNGKNSRYKGSASRRGL